MMESFPQTNKKEQLKALIERVGNLDEKYRVEQEKIAKANLWNQLEKAKKELGILEESLGKEELKKQETELEKLKILSERIKDLNEKYKFEMETEAKANLWNQLEKAKKELRIMEEKLDSQSKEKAKEIPAPIISQINPVVPEAAPTSTAVQLEATKKKFKAVLVDTTDVMKEQARDAGDASMTMQAPQNPNDLRGVKKFFKGEFWKRAGQKIWKHGLWRDVYRNKATAQARREILRTGNIFAGEGKDQASHDKFVSDVVEQFSSEYEETIHTDAGELRKRNEEIKNEQKIKVAIKKLITEYAEGKIDKEAFKEEENRLFKDLKENTEDKQIQKKEDIMYASSLFAVAEQVREAMRVGEFLAGEDFDIDLIYGKSKAGVRTEAKFTKAEALAEKLSHTKIGSLVNETTISTALAITTSIAERATRSGANLAAKILPFIGSALVGSGFAKLREAKKVEEERRQHAREMARGEKFDPARMERRREMEESRYQTLPAGEIIRNLVQSNVALMEDSASLTPEVLTQALVSLAAVEAKIRLSDRRNIDLISYSDTTKVVEERKNLDIEKAKMKVVLRKLFEAGKFTAPTGQNFETYFDSLAKTQETSLITAEDTGINAKDRIFNKMKSKRSWQAARTAFVTGLVIGTGMQEGMALLTDQTGMAEDLLRHNVNLIHGGSDITASGAHNFTALAQLKHYLSGDSSAGVKMSGGAALHDAFPGSHIDIKIPEGTSMIHNADGSYRLLSDGGVIANHLTINPDGTFTSASQNILHSSGINIDTHSIGGTTQAHLTPEEYVKNHPGDTTPAHRSWLENNTPMYPDPNRPGHMLGADLNELQTHWGGVHGTGINANGDYVLDIRHMTPEGSFEGPVSANAQALMKAGKMEMLVTLSKGTHGHAFRVHVQPDGQVIVPANSELGRIAFENTGGHAKFVGYAASMGHNTAGDNFEILSTVRGRGVTDIIDTVSTAKTETILKSTLGDYWSMPPFIPLVGRTPLEKTGMIEAVPYYMNYMSGGSEDQLAQFEKMRSQTLKENPNAKLDSFKEIDTYLKKLNPEYFEKIKGLAVQGGKMEAGCKVSICIPVAGHQEATGIYESLKNYTYQKASPESFELVLFVNHPEKDQKGNPLNATETLAEIERFKKDHPEIRVRVMYEALPNSEARIGRIRKLLADATLIRQNERGEGAPDLIMISNDADNKGIDPRYIQTFIDKFEGSEVDGLLGQLDWDPESYQKYPAIHIGTRLFQYLSVIGRHRTGGMVSSGANSAYRSSMYAGIGGYMDSLQGGEDIAIGRAIIAARDGDRGSFSFAGVGTRLFTSSRRSIDALNSGLSPVEQWSKGFSAFDDEIRKLTMEAGGKINYEDKKTLDALKKQIEYIINRTLNVWEEGEKLGKNSPYYRKALGWLGVKYSLDKKGDIVITDMKSLVEGLKKYQEEGKLMRDARSGKTEAADELKSKRGARKKNTPEEEREKEIKRLNSEELEKAVENFIDELPGNTEKIDTLVKILSRSLNNKLLKELGLDITVDEIKKDLEEAKKITSGAEFIERVKSILRPISGAMDEHPEEFPKLKRKIFVEYHNFTPINEIFSYRIDGGDLHIHLAPAEDFGAGGKIRLIKDALEKLIKIIASNKNVTEISATSPLVTSSPGLFKRIGFKLEGPISKERQEKDFGTGTDTASRATMSRKEFLDKYSKKKKFAELLFSWLEKLTKGK